MLKKVEIYEPIELTWAPNQTKGRINTSKQYDNKINRNKTNLLQQTQWWHAAAAAAK